MFGKGLITFLLVLANTWTSLAQTNAPIDLYLALDQSGSLSERRFRQLVNFAEALSFGVAGITGFYDEDANGLRVGAVTFGCGAQTKARLTPTGDADYIKDRMQNMRTYVVTYGETCLESAMKLLLEYKETQLAISPPSRATALVVLSDGRFDDFDAWQDELSNFQDDRTQGFAVGIGDNVRESDMIALADSKPDKYFHIDNPDALPTLIELIASMVINDFNAELVNTISGGVVSEDEEFCFGTPLEVHISGDSLGAFSASSALTCEFTVKDNVVSVSPTAVTVGGKDILTCEVPDLYGVDNSINFELHVNGNRVLSQQFIVNRSNCIELNKFIADAEVNNFQSCWGGVDAKVEFRKETAEFLGNSISQDGAHSLFCSIEYTTSINNLQEDIQILPEELEDEAGFKCALPNNLFEIDILDPTAVKLSVIYQQENVGQAEALVEYLDFSSQSNCLNYDLVDSNSVGNICLGQQPRIRLSGDSISNLLNRQDLDISITGCGSILQDSTKSGGEVIAEGSTLSCGLSKRLGLVSSVVQYVFVTFLLNNQEEQIRIPVTQFSLEPCYADSFPKKFIIESTTGDRVENERFCAGDGYEIEYSGSTFASFLEFQVNEGLQIFCDFQRIDLMEDSLFSVPAVINPDNTIVCGALRWEPYDEVGSQYYDLSNVKLYLRDEAGEVQSDFVNVDIYTGNSICFDDPDHNVPPGFDPPGQNNRALTERNLQTDENCFPACCKRESVSISFSGRTIGVLSLAQGNANGAVLRCVYSATDGTTVVTEVTLSGETATCGSADGWQLRGSSGDYSEVVLELLETDGSSRRFQNFVYNPTSGSVDCVYNEFLEYYCLGEPVFVRSYGLTLLALDVDPAVSYEESLFLNSLGENQLSVQILNDDQKSVISSWIEFDSDELFNGLEFNMITDGIQFFSETVSQVIVENLERCVDVSIARASCTDTADQFDTVIAAVGESIDFYPPSEGNYDCQFYNTGDEEAEFLEVSADTDTISKLVTCGVENSEAFSSYRIRYTNVNDGRIILLKEGSVNTTAVASCTDPIGGGDDRSSKGNNQWWLYVLVGCAFIALVLLVLFFVYKRRDKKQEPSKMHPSFLAPVIYGVGDKVEVFLPTVTIAPDTVEKIITSVEEEVHNDVKGFWFRGDIKEKLAASTDTESKSSTDTEDSDIEKGMNKFVYDVELSSVLAHYNLTESYLKKVKPQQIRVRSSDFAVDSNVKVGGEQVVYKIETVLANDKYEVIDVNNVKTILAGVSLMLLKDMIFKIGDQVFVKQNATSSYLSQADILEAKYIDQLYLVESKLTKEKFSANVDNVSVLEFAVGNIVQVSLKSDDGDITWKRAIIAKREISGTYKVIFSNEDGTAEENVEISRIRYPLFKVGLKVDVLSEASDAHHDTLVLPKADDWQPGEVEEILEDGVTYKVNLTRKGELVNVDANRLREQHLEEVVKRIRRGAPLRSKNIDSSVPESGDDVVPLSKRFIRRRPVDFTELPDYQFDITVNFEEGLGVKFGWTNEKVIVAGFKDMSNGDWGPLEATGLVMIKDQLLQIDDIDVANCGISDISELINNSKENKRIKLRFGRSDEFKAVFKEEAQSVTTT